MILMVAIVYFRKSFLIFFFSLFLRLSLPKEKASWFCNNFLVVYQRLFSFKLMIFKTFEFSWFKKCNF